MNKKSCFPVDFDRVKVKKCIFELKSHVLRQTVKTNTVDPYQSY